MMMDSQQSPVTTDLVTTVPVTIFWGVLFSVSFLILAFLLFL